MHTYAEVIDYLYHAAPAFEKTGAAAYKEGMANTVALDNHFGNPHRHYAVIHVAGTNGKGSCSHTLAAILQRQGLRTGLYTSPHLLDFRERIRVDGVPVSEERVIRFVEEERAFFEPLHPSFFELTTALAFKYFEEEKVDIAVVEVGLGGRLDCTNVVKPLLSVITNISLDHTQFLGDTLAKIAAEKAGIIKENTPCIIGEIHPETRPVFERIAAARHAPLFFADELLAEAANNGKLAIAESLFELKGACQKRNIRTILAAVKLLRRQMAISDDAITGGLAQVCELTGLAGRWQTVNKEPLVVCDTGHNLAGWQLLAPQIKAVDKEKKRLSKGRSSLKIVFGMVDDKDVGGVMDLLPRDAEYFFCQAGIKRAIEARKLVKMAEGKGLRGTPYPTVGEAYSAALRAACNDDFIFVGGSSYVVADFLCFISRTSQP
ncbi:MAG: bifunctional folylpolyglutamate synthase/dihydrofolate synthase [Prevotella sp.]|nr:bifunctional folylpolyglutamate synthase/dihydrofolate synthase [Prevotella sp.]